MPIISKRRGLARRLNEILIMEFIEIWNLLAPQGEYKRRMGACQRLWQGYSADMQQRIYTAISEALPGGEVNPNPYFAIEDAALELKAQAPKRQVLSMADYYAKYGTTSETDGWHMENPTGNKVIYVK